MMSSSTTNGSHADPPPGDASSSRKKKEGNPGIVVHHGSLVHASSRKDKDKEKELFQQGLSSKLSTNSVVAALQKKKYGWSDEQLAEYNSKKQEQEAEHQRQRANSAAAAMPSSFFIPSSRLAKPEVAKAVPEEPEADPHPVSEPAAVDKPAEKAPSPTLPLSKDNDLDNTSPPKKKRQTSSTENSNEDLLRNAISKKQSRSSKEPFSKEAKDGKEIKSLENGTDREATVVPPSMPKAEEKKEDLNDKDKGKGKEKERDIAPTSAPTREEGKGIEIGTTNGVGNDERKRTKSQEITFVSEGQKTSELNYSTSGKRLLSFKSKSSDEVGSKPTPPPIVMVERKILDRLFKEVGVLRSEDETEFDWDSLFAILNRPVRARVLSHERSASYSPASPPPPPPEVKQNVEELLGTNVFTINFEEGRKSIVFDPLEKIGKVLDTLCKTHNMDISDYIVSTTTGEGVPLNTKLGEIPGAEVNVMLPLFAKLNAHEVIQRLKAEKKDNFCHVCFKGIRDDQLSIQLVTSFEGNAKVHNSCFCCQKCTKSLTAGDYLLNLNELNCKSCFEKENGRTCKSCQKEVDYSNPLSFLKYGDGLFHAKPSCLRCKSCDQPLAEEDGKIKPVVVLGDDIFDPDCAATEQAKGNRYGSKNTKTNRFSKMIKSMGSNKDLPSLTEGSMASPKPPSILMTEATPPLNQSRANRGSVGAPTRPTPSTGGSASSSSPTTSTSGKLDRSSSMSKIQVRPSNSKDDVKVLRHQSSTNDLQAITEDVSAEEGSKDSKDGTLKDSGARLKEGSTPGPKLKKGPKTNKGSIPLTPVIPHDPSEPAPELKSVRMAEAASEIKDALSNENWHLHFSDIHFEKKLGKGASATVYLAQYKDTETVAVKLIRMEDEEKDLELFKKELIIMSLLNHPNIVKFYGATLEPKMCFVIEFCPNGTLTDYMQLPDKTIDWNTVVQWSYEIALGVKALHTFDPPVVHRDLKSMNILLSADLTCKVCDFGLSRYTKPSLIKALQRRDTLATLRGTYMYTAPEIYHKKDYTTASDVYSLGMIVWEMCQRALTGAYVRPFTEYPQLQFDFQIIYATAVQNMRPTIPDGIPKELYMIISDCFKGEPDERPTCAVIVKTLVKLNRKSVKNLFGLIKQ